MKFYTASKCCHARLWRDARQDHKIVSSWIDEAGEGQTASYSELSSRCLSEIRQADRLILLAAKGEILKGALIEAGMALALGIPVFCLDDGSPSISRVFKEHPLWKSCDSLEGLFAP